MKAWEDMGELTPENFGRLSEEEKFDMVSTITMAAKDILADWERQKEELARAASLLRDARDLLRKCIPDRDGGKE